MNESETPKYISLKNTIIDNINNEVYHEGDLLPSESSLTKYFGVSRITVRRALLELENEGYLYKVQGKGTFVKNDKNHQNLISLTSCTQDIIRMGMTPSRKVYCSEIVKANKQCCENLSLNEDEPVFALSRVYYADNEPINYTTTYLPYKFVNGIENFDFGKTSLYDVLENKYEIKITRAVRTINAITAYGDICDKLQISNGVPLLLFNCITYGTLGGKEYPIETFKCYYRSDKFSFAINQVR